MPRGTSSLSFSEEPQGQSLSERELPTDATENAPVKSAPEPVAPVMPESPGVSADAATNFFLSAMDMVEQQRFLNFCEARQLSPAAGILLFLKEPLQRDQLNPIAANVFADDAQAVIDAIQPQAAPQQVGIPRPQNARKPTKPCAVCGKITIVEFLGRELCSNEECWHTYAGIQKSQQVGGVTGTAAGMEQRFSKLESLVNRMAGMMDRLVGAS